MIARCTALATTPPRILNLTGTRTLSVRARARAPAPLAPRSRNAATNALACGGGDCARRRGRAARELAGACSAGGRFGLQRGSSARRSAERRSSRAGRPRPRCSGTRQRWSSARPPRLCKGSAPPKRPHQRVAHDSARTSSARGQSCPPPLQVRLLGPPRVPVEQMVAWVGAWVAAGQRSLGKPTKFEARNGRF